jgi:hypothetical protein
MNTIWGKIYHGFVILALVALLAMGGIASFAPAAGAVGRGTRNTALQFQPDGDTLNVVNNGSSGTIDFQTGSTLQVDSGATETHANTESHTGTETHSGAVSLTGGQTVTGLATFNSGITAGYGITASTGGISATGLSTFNSGITVTYGITASSGGISATGLSTFNSGLAETGNLTVTGSLSVTNGITTTGGLTITTQGLVVQAGGISVTSGISRSVNLPITSFVGCTGAAAYAIPFSNGADTKPELLNTTNVGETLEFDVVTQVDTDHACQSVMVPADYQSGGTFRIESNKTGDTGATEILTCAISINGAAALASGTVTTAGTAAANYTCTPTITGLAAGNSMGFSLWITSGGTANDGVGILSVRFEYLAVN